MRLSDCVTAGSGAVLPPAGTSPHVLANAIKHFLVTMPEPLLTYKWVLQPSASAICLHGNMLVTPSYPTCTASTNPIMQLSPNDRLSHPFTTIVSSHVIPMCSHVPHVVTCTPCGYMHPITQHLSRSSSCHRLLPQLIQHGSQQPALANLVLAELPAANQCTLQLLLETFHRLSGNAAVNEMDAHTVATVITPCVAWNPPPKPKASSWCLQKTWLLTSKNHSCMIMWQCVLLLLSWHSAAWRPAYSLLRQVLLQLCSAADLHVCPHKGSRCTVMCSCMQSSFSIPGMSSSPTAPQMQRTSSGRQISVAPNLNTVLEGDESAGDGSPSGSLARIQLDDDDTHAIVRVLEHLIANYKQLSEAPNSPLYRGPLA